MSGIDGLRAHYGFGTRMPFGKDLAPGMLHAHRCHAEAAARIGWCVTESAIGVVTGECGSGKTVAARAALGALDGSRHTTVYLGAPGVGLRGMYAAITSALGGTPRFHCSSLIPQTQDLLADSLAPLRPAREPGSSPARQGRPPGTEAQRRGLTPAPV